MPTANENQVNDIKKKYGSKHKEAINNYDKEYNMEQVMIRFPKGYRQIVKSYVTAKAKEDPTNPRYSAYNGKAWLPSVNALVNALVHEELSKYE